ncbi:hypothetical protein H4R18_002698 [Coemansia javaensis]|uniref:Uncharacterized protein n=1 Tax=Coemansia javaensis TaxID=2761396 RepID=A0A9W8LJI2_9FUNG|nr:hypothetical protein H4R18_002698 [Coemansia javaensis]
MAAADGAPQSKRRRRRLLSRRELRHQGTRIVRVGSENVLQANRGPYTFAALDAAAGASPTPPPLPDDPDREAIASSGASADEAPEAPPPSTPPRADGRPLHRLTLMSERAQRLRVSPTQRRSLTARLPRAPDTISPPSSPSGLPPPLDLDRNILSFTQHQPARPGPPPAAHDATACPPRHRRRRLTPLRRVPEGLRAPAARPPPPLFSTRRPLA